MNSPELTGYERALDAELAAYRSLLKAMEDHEKALTRHDPREINDCLQVNLTNLENARQAAAARKAMDEDCAEDAAQPLRGKLMELGKLGREIRHRNERNRRLVEHSLDLLRGEFRALDAMIQSAMGRSPEERAGGSLVSLQA